MRKSKIKQITLAVCLAFMPISVFAAGLGKLNVNSGLGEPLNAEIELLSLSADELETLTAAIASEDAYAAQGLSRAYIHSNIKVELGKSFSGAPVLKVRSSVPVDDPFLDMLVQVDWATGRLQREYTVLLDPPGYQAVLEPSTPLKITAPTINQSASSAVANSNTGAGNKPIATTPTQSVNKPVKATPKVADKPVMPEPKAVEDSTAQTELTTVRGDTLSSIASRMQTEGVSLDQMLMALYDNNKNAFIGNNINQLKVGQIIRLPSSEQLTARSAKEASQQVKVHASNWNDYRNSLAGVVATTPVASATPEEKQVVTGKIATAEDKAAPIKAGPQDVVKLSSGDKEKTTATKNSNKAFEEKISALQEETTAREKALQEAQERSNALEKQIQDMQKLLALKSQTMANVQKNAESLAANNASSMSESAKEAIPTTQDESTAEKPESQPIESAAVSKDTPTNAVDNVKAESAPVKPPVVTPPVDETLAVQPSFIDSLLESTNPLYIGLGLILALLLGGWLYLRDKRKRDLDSFERGILTSGGLRANTVFGNTTGATGNSDTSFLTDFAQSADGSMIDTNDVDPIAEAEVYMAYGRDAQAEEILKDAITKEPTRYELHLKLLEMYAARQDVSAFETIAGELYTTLGADDPTWEKVAAIGAVMEPGNPLYSAGGVVNEPTATQKLDASDFTGLNTTDDLDLDFSADMADAADSAKDNSNSANSVIEASFATANRADQTETFEFEAAQQFKVESLGSLADSSGINFGASAAEDSTNTTLDVKAESNAMDFDLSDFSFDAPTLAEPTDTKAQTENAFELPVELKDEADNSVEFTSVPNDFPSFDLPENDATEANGYDSRQAIESVEDKDLNKDKMSSALEVNEIDFNFDLSDDSVNDTPQKTSANHSTFDPAPTDEMSESDMLSTKNTTENNEKPTEFDLSSISFDLDEPADSSAQSFEAVAENAPKPPPESEDVAIKLDLVAAYIEMDDKEGARELLEEVLKEGGLEQQKRAQTLLADLN